MTVSMRCDRCNAPAVLGTRTKAFSCARQCTEPPVETTRRFTLEHLTAALGRRLKSEMTAGVEFCLLLFDPGSWGSSAYATIGDRDACKAALRELLRRLESEGPDAGPDTGEYIHVLKHGVWVPFATIDDFARVMCPTCRQGIQT